MPNWRRALDAGWTTPTPCRHGMSFIPTRDVNLFGLRRPAAVTPAEFLHLSRSVDDATVAGPKGVRIRGDLDDNKRIGSRSVRSLPLDRTRTGHRRPRQKRRARVGVLKDDWVVVGVYAGFHPGSPS